VSSEAEACPALVPDDRAALSISLGDGSASDFMIDVFERRDEEGDLLRRDCYANVVIPLSAFPSASNRLDTGAIARSMQESASALGVERCDVQVLYEDPERTLPVGERCVTASFGFSQDAVWSTEAEARCWSDEEIERWEEIERQEAAEADAWALEQEAHAPAEEWGEEYDDAVALEASEAVVLASAGRP